MAHCFWSWGFGSRSLSGRRNGGLDHAVTGKDNLSNGTLELFEAYITKLAIVGTCCVAMQNPMAVVQRQAAQDVSPPSGCGQEDRAVDCGINTQVLDSG